MNRDKCVNRDTHVSHLERQKHTIRLVKTNAHVHTYTNSSENTQTCLNTGSNCAYTPALCTDNGYIQLKHTW